MKAPKEQTHAKLFVCTSEHIQRNKRNSQQGETSCYNSRT